MKHRQEIADILLKHTPIMFKYYVKTYIGSVPDRVFRDLYEVLKKEFK